MKFTAHIREDKGEMICQSVYVHCENVENRSAAYASSFQASGLAELAGILHDAGKLCKDFDDYIHGRNELTRGSIDHCFAGARFLTEFANKTGNRKVIETVETPARAIMSHHGIHDWIEEDGNDYFQSRVKKEERYSEIESNIRNMISENDLLRLLRKAVSEYGDIRRKIIRLAGDGRKKKKCAFYFGLFERLMESVLVDADRTDTADFQWNKNTEKEFDKDIWVQLQKEVEGYCAGFAARTDQIAVLRSDISERCRCFAEHETGICRMIVPTGGGKTISSLRFAVNYCRNHGKERIFYIAPYMSILEQNAAVFKDIVGTECVLEHHSNILSCISDDNELNEYELRTDKWDLPIVATTLVQLLNTFFSDRMDLVRRMHRLSNAVIIIDEVQSVPVRCVHLFNLAMNFISHIGNSCVVLCSATQPRFEETEYGLVLDQKSSMTGDYEPDFRHLKRNRLVPVKNMKGQTYDEAAVFCKEKFEEKGSILFVVNTKKAALELYERLKHMEDGKIRVIHLSTNMCPNRRKLIIDEIRLRLGKQEEMICITTQLVEAGVDISFPCVIRSIAGLDNAAQAAGRCNRNGEWGSLCDVYLINLKEECIGMLPDIRDAQLVTKQVIRNQEYRELLSVDTMSAYFKKYYSDRQEELSYKTEDIDLQTNIVNMLSTDEDRWRMCHEGKISMHAQAFKSAGRKFQVIDQNTISVIVPDNEEAKALISALRSNCHEWDFISLLRSAQKFTVGIYQALFKKFEEKHAVERLPCGVYVMQEEYYDQNIGIVLEGRPMDFLMF